MGVGRRQTGRRLLLRPAEAVSSRRHNEAPMCHHHQSPNLPASGRRVWFAAVEGQQVEAPRVAAAITVAAAGRWP